MIQSSPAPLTTAEEELRQIKISEVLHLGLEAKLFLEDLKQSLDVKFPTA